MVLEQPPIQVKAGGEGLLGPYQFQCDSWLLLLLLVYSGVTQCLGTFLSNQSNNTNLTVTYLYSCDRISTDGSSYNLIVEDDIGKHNIVKTKTLIPS